MRRELNRRPLLGLACGLAIGLASPGHPWMFLLLLGLLVLFENAGLRIGLVVVALVGAIMAPLRHPPVSERQYVAGAASVVSVPRIAGNGQSMIVSLNDLRLSLLLPLDVDIGFGDELKVSGVAKPLREGTDWLNGGHGIVGQLEPAELVPVQRGPEVLRIGRTWRDSFRAVTTSYLTKESKTLADALCFNVESTLDPELMTHLRKTGTVHIVSASGLHVGIFAVFLQGVLSRAPINRRWQLAVLLLVLILYMGATGMRPPVVRSVIMAGVLLSGYLLRREADLLSALGFACILQMLWNPYSVFDPSLHLSIAAVVGLGLFVRFDSPGLGWKSWLLVRGRQTAHASLVATLATAPLIGYAFGQVSVIAVVANLLVTPLVLIIVPLSMVAWAAAWLVPVAQTLMAPVEWACQALAWIVNTLGSLPFAVVNVPEFSAWWIPVWYLAMIGLWRKRVRPP